MLGVNREEPGLSRRYFLFSGSRLRVRSRSPCCQSGCGESGRVMLGSGRTPISSKPRAKYSPLENAAGVDAVGMVGAAEVMAADTEAAEAEVMVVDTEAVEVMAAATAVTGAAAALDGRGGGWWGGRWYGWGGPAGSGGRRIGWVWTCRDTGQVLPSFPETGQRFLAALRLSHVSGHLIVFHELHNVVSSPGSPSDCMDAAFENLTIVGDLD